MKKGARPLDEKVLVQILRHIRWPGAIKCPTCYSIRVTKSGRHQRLFQRYRCKNCRRIFNDKTGTIFEGSGKALSVWFLAAALLKNGQTIKAISRRLGVSYATAFRMVKKLRKEEYYARINEMVDVHTGT